MSPYTAIIFISLLLIVSYIFQVISRKTNIPSVLMLMALGIIIKLFIPHTLDNLDSYLGILGNIGLILIVLEASLDLNLHKDKTLDILKALFSALLCLSATSAIIAGIIYWLNYTTFMQAALYAVPFAVMSSAIVIPSVQNIFPKTKEFVIYESSISDILGIIFFYLFLDLNENENTGEVLGITLFQIIVTIVIAFILSYALIWMFTKIKDNTKLFLIISSLVLLYGVGKLFHLSSLIIIVIFGLILKNQTVFFKGSLKKIHDEKEAEIILHDLHHITLESVFVIKTFFFFLFGFSINLMNLLDIKGIFTGVLILGGTYCIRYFVLSILRVQNISLLTTITPRGLISILLFFSIPATLFIPEFGNAPMLFTIIVTNIVMTLGLISDSKKETTEESEAPVTQPITSDHKD